MTHIAIIIDIFEIPLVSADRDGVGIIRAFIVALVDGTRIDMAGFMVTIRVFDVVFVNLGPIELTTMRSLRLVLFTAGNDVVRTVFDFDEIVDGTFPIDFGVVDVTFNDTNFFTIVYSDTLFEIDGIGDVDLKINFVVTLADVVEFEIDAEILTRPDVTFIGFAGVVVIILGVEVFNVEFDAFIGVKVPTVFTVGIWVVIETILIFCVLRVLSVISFEGVVISSNSLVSEVISLNGVVVISDSVESPNKCLDRIENKKISSFIHVSV